MAEKKFNLRIITPHEVALDEQVDMAIMRCTTGDMGVMFGHEAHCAVLDYGILRIFNDEQSERWLAVYGGLAQIKDNVLTVLTGGIEWPHEVNVKSAQEQREHIKQRLREHEDDVTIRRDEVLLRRALVQIELSSYPHLAKTDEYNYD